MTKDTVVLVHGLWMNGLDMSLLKNRLQTSGFLVKQFSYPSVRRTPLENAMDLNAYIKTVNTDIIHFVCHSLGGIVIRHLFHAYPDQKPGRIVTLGSPHQPSSAARQLTRFIPGEIVLGKSTVKGLLGDIPAWKSGHELGSIAGTLRFGLGTIVPGIPRPNDGTVAVAETKVEGMKDHLCVKASHFGLLLSKTVANNTIHFLKAGSFKK